MLKQVTNGIFVGDLSAVNKSSEMPNLTVIINLSGKDYSRTQLTIDGVTYRAPPNTEVVDFVLPGQELMDVEKPKTIVKLEAIAKTIAEFRASNKTILIHDLDGKNKCMLALGYYMIKVCGENALSTTRKLETLYFTKQQIIDDDDDIRRMQEYDPDDEPVEYTTEELKAILKGQEERRALRCLTMGSFVRLLNGL